MLIHIDWKRILNVVAADCERRYDLELVIDDDVVREVAAAAAETLEGFRKPTPNVAKIAGCMCFWIRKLKPISHAETSRSKYLAINELVALKVGIAICGYHYGDGIRTDFARIDFRVVADWANSLRRHSHSPQATVMAFEILAADLTAPVSHPP